MAKYRKNRKNKKKPKKQEKQNPIFPPFILRKKMGKLGKQENGELCNTDN